MAANTNPGWIAHQDTDRRSPNVQLSMEEDDPKEEKGQHVIFQRKRLECRIVRLRCANIEPDKWDTEPSPAKIRDEISPDNELYQSAAYIVFGFAFAVTTVAKSSSPPRCESSQLYLRCADMEPDKKGSEAVMAEKPQIQVGFSAPPKLQVVFSPIIG
ncbi:hypothetical protein Tco_0190669 [Tanacetum coccineum]